jgi:hypothetical protein
MSGFPTFGNVGQCVKIARMRGGEPLSPNKIIVGAINAAIGGGDRFLLPMISELSHCDTMDRLAPNGIFRARRKAPSPAAAHGKPCRRSTLVAGEWRVELVKLTFCVACGTTEGLNHHHLRPRVHGGSDAETNLITLCRSCHGLMQGSDWWERNYWSNERSELIKARIAAARARRIDGPKGYAKPTPETIALAKQLHADGLSYRKISAALAAQGHTTGSGKPHTASAVQKMLGR